MNGSAFNKSVSLSKDACHDILYMKLIRYK